MITSVTMNRFIYILPAFDLGKIRSLLKVDAPVRPIPSQWRAKRIARISRYEGDHEGWLGTVYSSQDGQRLVFHCTESTNDVREDNTSYLKIDPMGYIDTAIRLPGSRKKGPGFYGLYSDIENKEDATKTVSQQDRAWVEYCIAPDKPSSAPAEQNTLG